MTMPSKLSNTDAPLVTFTFEEKFTLRGLLHDGQPWFVAADAILALDLDRKALERLDDDEKGVSSIHTLGGTQQMTIISESGLYSLILGSRKPSAKRFKKWVTSEVLPSIRKTGSYSMGQVAQPAFQIPTTLSGALALAAQLAEQNEQQQAQIARIKSLIYRAARSELEFEIGKSKASSCGRELRKWRDDKPRMKEELKQLYAQLQLPLLN